MRRCWIPSLAVCACLVMLGSARADGAELVLLFTNDMHSQLLPRRVRAADKSMHESGGVARLATLLARQRARSPDAVVLVDAGDFSMGTLFHTRFAEGAYELGHLGRLGYDAVTLGNHDFDFLPQGLAAALQTAKARGPVPKIVAANTQLPAGGDALTTALRIAFRAIPVTPYVVLERAGVRIGVFGIMGRDAAGDAPFARPVTFGDPVETSRAIVETLRERVDVVIALSHSGTAPPPGVSEDEELARLVPGIDVIVSGHTHRALPRPLQVGNTHIVRAGASLANLGVLSLRASKRGVAVLEHHLEPIDESVAEDVEVARRVASERAEVEQTYLARWRRGWDEVIASFGFDPERLDDERSLGELALGDLVTDAYAWAVQRAEGAGAHPVDVVLHPRGHLRESFVRGHATTADVFSVLSLGLGPDHAPGYPLVSFFVSGAELRDMLEVEATVAPKKRTAHLQVSGARFSYNPHRLPCDRVTEAHVRTGAERYEPLDPQRRYRVVMNYYVASRLDLMQRASHGLLSATPRDASGRPITELARARVDADPTSPGVQELKEWTALAAFLSAFPDADGDRVPDVPVRYARPALRFEAKPSWSPLALVRGGMGLTRALVCALAAVLTVLSMWALRRRAR